MGFNRFNIEGLGFEESRKHIAENLGQLQSDFTAGEMKAGRYISLYYLMEAAQRGDITSQIALGSLYEFGNIVDRDTQEAKRWYRAAIEKDHPKQDGTMLAAAAAEAMKRLSEN